MKTLYIERSTGDCRNGDWVEQLDLDGVERIVVGTGPGSFAGIRSAIAFAQGYALGRPGMEVLGLPSPCAVAAELLGTDPGRERRIAVLGDARQGKIWVALFKGYLLEKEVFQTDLTVGQSGTDPRKLLETVPDNYMVASPDDRRIGEMLRGVFGERYLGGKNPTAEGLRAFAEACPSVLKPEPLPIYLNPAVRN